MKEETRKMLLGEIAKAQLHLKSAQCEIVERGNTLKMWQALMKEFNRIDKKSNLNRKTCSGENDAKS